MLILRNFSLKSFVIDSLSVFSLLLRLIRWWNKCYVLKCFLWDKKTLTRRCSRGRCSIEKVFLKISQNSQEITCVRASFLIEFQASPATLLKKRLWHRCFPMNFETFLRFYRTPPDDYFCTGDRVSWFEQNWVTRRY